VEGDAETSDLDGKVVLVTGATSGIGKVTARELARSGATVVLVARDRAKGEAVVREIRAATSKDTLELLVGDLAVQRDVRRIAAEFKQRHDRLEVLVNAAGAVFGERRLTEDGVERTFALNHLAYFLLTNLLLDELKAGAPSRVVNVASDAALQGRIDFADLQSAKMYRGMRVYANTKLANILFTREAARRLAGTGITVNSVHPGFVRTNFGTTGSGVIRVGTRLASRFARTPEKGAETVVCLASSRDVEGVSGRYYFDLQPKRAPAVACDGAVARRLWDVSEQLTGLATAGQSAATR